MNLNEFIQKLGGTTKAAEVFSVTPAAVSNWKKAGRLPDRLHHKAAKVAEQRGVEFDPERHAA